MKCQNWHELEKFNEMHEFEWREKKLYEIKKFNEIQELNEGKKPSMKF
jgi:hypothetical protein